MKKNGHRICIVTNCNKKVVLKILEYLNINDFFDIIIDDGPHSLESMIVCVQKYLPKLKSDGILVIEDLKELSWAETLTEYVPSSLKNKVSVYDFRHIKSTSDDIAFVIDLK